MGNTVSSSEHDVYFKNHADSSQAEKKAATKAIIKKLKEGRVVNSHIVKENIEIFEKASKVVEKYFPGAGSGGEIHGQVKAALDRIGCTSSNTLFAQSICPDEINHEEDDLTRLFHAHLGEVFHMGGLAGIPFTGRTGFAAYSHHIPDNGNLFILFAPHVGISENGNVGEYSRLGQSHDGKACGAAAAGLSHCCSNSVIPTLSDIANDPHDYQQQVIIREIQKRLKLIQDKASDFDPNEMQAELAFQMYDIVKCFLNEIVTTDFHKDGSDGGKLIILGGIQINMPFPMEDYFLPISFEIRARDKPTVNILEETFSNLIL